MKVQYSVFVWGGHPAQVTYPDKDRRPGLQLEVFASAQNMIHFSERARPSLGPEPPGEFNRVREKMSSHYLTTYNIL